LKSNKCNVEIFDFELVENSSTIKIFLLPSKKLKNTQRYVIMLALVFTPCFNKPGNWIAANCL